MAEYRVEVDEIMQKYNAGELTIDEANKELDGIDGVVDGHYGVGFYLDPDKGKDCNAWMECGVGAATPVKVEDGKVVYPTGMHPSYWILYDGKIWHVSYQDNMTLIEGKPEQWPVGDKEPVPTLEEAMKRNKDNAGKVVRTSTKNGVFDIHYNDMGYAVKATKV